MSEAAEFHTRRLPMATALVFFVLLCVSEAYALSQAAVLSEGFFAAAVALVLCGMIAFVLTQRLRDGMPQLAIGEAGVMSRNGDGEWAPWSQITKIGFMERKRPVFAPKRPRLVVMVGMKAIQDDVKFREGSLPEIAAAIDRFMPKDTDPERADAWRESKHMWELD